MAETSSSAGAPSEREIVLSRVYDAPRDLVWKAWTDPGHIVQWWGPTGFTTTTRQMELRTGGQWRFVMHGPDGRDYENLITYLEVKEPERLSYKHGGDIECEPVNFQVLVTFEKEGANGEKTKLTMRSTFPSKNARDYVVREYNAIEGGKQTLERLGEHVGSMRAARAGAESSDPPFAITRVVGAPIERVWEVWTQREHMMRWFGPKSFTMPACKLDLRPGGVFHYGLKSPDGKPMWGRWDFREIVPMERLVFTMHFSDENGGVARSPFSNDWPLDVLTTISFARHAGIGGGTVVTIQSVPINASAVERATFLDTHGSMTAGWSGTFEQLATYLTSNR